MARLSGAQLNPAVTVALAVIGRFPWRQVPLYVVAQFAGGILAGLMNWLMFGTTAQKTRSSSAPTSSPPSPHWWVYIVGPLAGAVLGGALWELALKYGSADVVESAGGRGS